MSEVDEQKALEDAWGRAQDQPDIRIVDAEDGDRWQQVLDDNRLLAEYLAKYSQAGASLKEMNESLIIIINNIAAAAIATREEDLLNLVTGLCKSTGVMGEDESFGTIEPESKLITPNRQQRRAAARSK